MATFKEAIIICVQEKYATFGGRASRSEFWFFYLFNVLAQITLTIIGKILGFGDILASLFALALLIPNIAVGSRRLHDIGWSGWWQLMMLTIIGLIPLIIMWCLKSEPNANKYGEPEIR